MHVHIVSWSIIQDMFYAFCCVKECVNTEWVDVIGYFVVDCVFFTFGWNGQIMCWQNLVMLLLVVISFFIVKNAYSCPCLKCRTINEPFMCWFPQWVNKELYDIAQFVWLVMSISGLASGMNWGQDCLLVACYSYCFGDFIVPLVVQNYNIWKQSCISELVWSHWAVVLSLEIVKHMNAFPLSFENFKNIY